MTPPKRYDQTIQQRKPYTPPEIQGVHLAFELGMKIRFSREAFRARWKFYRASNDEFIGVYNFGMSQIEGLGRKGQLIGWKQAIQVISQYA